MAQIGYTFNGKLTRNDSYMLRILLAVFLFAWCAAPSAGAQDFHRLSISLTRVSSDLDDIKVNLRILWGANVSPTERRPEWLEPISETPSRRRDSSEIALGPYSFEGPEDVEQVLIFGTITDNKTGDVVRVIPATIVDLQADQNDMVTLSVSVERGFPEAFRASYPFVFLRDKGFIDDDTIRPTLVAIRYFIEESGRNGYRLSDEEWGRIKSFFGRNESYFEQGGASHVVEILNYFDSYSAISDDMRFHNFYAEFLNNILDDIDNRKVNSQSLHQLVLENLDTLFNNNLSDMFAQADITLKILEQREYYLMCIDISRTILAKMDRDFLESINAPRNTRSVLGMSNRCGQLLYASERGASASDVEGAATYLASFKLGKSLMGNFITVIRDLDSLGQLRVTDERDSLLGTYFRAYSEALGGQG
jgi:hypothetical protein